MTPEQEAEAIKNIVKHNFPNEYSFWESKYQSEEVEDNGGHNSGE